MNIQEIVKNIQSLPPAPQILPKLLEIMNNPDGDNRDIVEIVSMDAALTAQVLRISNSVHYAGRTRISDLGEAVARLGLKEIYRIVSSVPATGMFSKEFTALEIEEGKLWEHSLACAMIMDELVDEETYGIGMPYTVGLVHDIGKLVLQEVAPDDYGKVFQLVESDQVSLNGAEQKMFGFDHAEAGAALLEFWHFPPNIYEAIRHLYHPDDAGEYTVLATAVHVANWLAGVMGCSHGRDVWAIDIAQRAEKLLKLDQMRIESLIAEVQDRFYRAQLKLRQTSTP